jgi:hypothetical protein
VAKNQFLYDKTKIPSLFVNRLGIYIEKSAGSNLGKVGFFRGLRFKGE